MASKAETWTDRAKKLGDDVRSAGHNAWMFGVGTIAVAGEETQGFYSRMVEKGEQFDESEDNVIRKAVHETADRVRDIGRKVEGLVEGTVGSTLNRAGVPSRDEIRTLIQRVEQLNRKVDALAKKS